MTDVERSTNTERMRSTNIFAQVAGFEYVRQLQDAAVCRRLTDITPQREILIDPFTVVDGIAKKIIHGLEERKYHPSQEQFLDELITFGVESVQQFTHYIWTDAHHAPYTHNMMIDLLISIREKATFSGHGAQQYRRHNDRRTIRDVYLERVKGLNNQ